MLRVRGQPGVIHPRHRGVRLQPSGQQQRLGALGAHAQVQRLQALEYDPGVEGRQRHTSAFEHGQKLLGDDGLAGTQGAGHHPALPVEVLGARVHDDVGPHRHRPLQAGRGKAVVHGKQRAGVVRQIGQGLDVAHLGQRVGRRLDKEQTRVGAQRSAPGTQIGLRDKSGFHAKLGQIGTDQLDRRAEHGTRTQHMVTGLQQAHAHHQNGRHTRGGADGGLRAFQSGQTLLEAADRGVAIAAIGVAVFFTGEAAGSGLGVGLHIAAGQKQGFRVFPILAGSHGSALGQGIGVQAGWQGFGRHGFFQLKYQETGLGRARREVSCSSSTPPTRAALRRAISAASTSPVT